MRNPFRCFNSSPEVTRLAVVMYIRYPLSLRQVEGLLYERGIDICRETRGSSGTDSVKCSPQRPGMASNRRVRVLTTVDQSAHAKKI